MLAQIGAERTVQAEGQRADVVKAGFRKLRGSVRERASRSVGDRAGNHHRQSVATLATGFFEELFDGEQRRFGVERVEDCFDEQDVGAAIGQAANRLAVVLDQFVKAGVAKARVVRVEVEMVAVRDVEAEHSGDKARLGRVFGGEFVTRERVLHRRRSTHKPGFRAFSVGL